MNLIRNLPGPLLIFLGALSLSFGGLIVKSFDGATLWQILFWRSLFFSLTVLTFLIISYKKKTFNSFYESGLPGLFGGIVFPPHTLIWNSVDIRHPPFLAPNLLIHIWFWL